MSSATRKTWGPVMGYYRKLSRFAGGQWSRFAGNQWLALRGLCSLQGPVNQCRRTCVNHPMTGFATLAPPYSMPSASHGDVELSDSTTNSQSRALNQFLAGVELKAFKIAQAALRHE